MDAKIDQPWSVLALQAPVRGAVARHRCRSVFRYLSILIPCRTGNRAVQNGARNDGFALPRFAHLRPVAMGEDGLARRVGVA